MDKILLTGASGFIGSHIAEYFLSKNIKLDCLVRESSNTDFLNTLNLKILYGNISNLKSLTEIFKNYNCVIHTAGYVSDWGNFDKFFSSNVIGTLNVLKACKKNNIENIIITGTNSVYGEENNLTVKDENSPFNSHYNYFLDNYFHSSMNYYRDSKAAAVKYALKYAEKNDMNLTVIEPVWVFGEREFNAGFYEYLKTVNSGIPFLPGSKKNLFHIIYARDLSKCYYLAYKKKLNGIHRFIAGNDKPVNLDYLYSLFCNSLKKNKPMNLKKFIVYPVGFFLEMIYNCLNINKPPILTRARVNMFYDNIIYSTKKIKEILGFQPDYCLEDAVEKTVTWYKKNNFL